MATTRLYRTPNSAGTRTKWTWSSWIKLAPQPNDVSYWGQTLFCATTDANNYTELAIQNSGFMDFVNVTGGSVDARLVTSRVFRDCTGWMHVLVVWDTANGTAGDRMKIYINGVEETVFGTDTNPSSSLNSFMNSNVQTEIGSNSGGGNYFNGAMAHTHFVDGQASAPTVFGEVDSTSGIWKPKTSPSVTYGTNGFFLKYASGATGTDSSGQNNTMTVAGTITSLKDNPENNFCTLNPLDANGYSTNSLKYTEVMNTVVAGGNNWKSTMSTMAVTTGKFYFETKIIGSSTNWWIGIVDPSQIQYASGNNKYTDRTRGYGFNYTFDKGNSGSEVAWGYNTSIAQNDIVCVAVDITNSKIYARKNGGAWANTSASPAGDPTSGATGTGSAYTLTQNNGQNIQYMPFVASYSTTAKLSCNFGAGYFGTTAVASAGTNASGVGTFEFDVPTGYTAFSTKGLNI